MKNAARLMVLGVSLGVAAFILNVLLTYQVTSALAAVLEPSNSVPMWILTRLLIEQLGVLLVAPVLAYVAGLWIEGRRFPLAMGMVLTLQATGHSVRYLSLGRAAMLQAEEILLFLGAIAVGIALSSWAMGRGQARAQAREGAAPAPAENKLAAIDFEAVKRQAAAAEAPTAAAAPASEAPAAPKAEEPGKTGAA